MLGFKRVQFYGSLTSTGSSTATIFAAGGSGTKWVLNRGIIGCIGPAAGATLTFQETYPAGTALGVLMKFPFAVSNVSAIDIDFGDEGFQASATNSRLVWLVEGANASANIAFVGYYR
jgi:hypothetical protein